MIFWKEASAALRVGADRIVAFIDSERPESASFLYGREVSTAGTDGAIGAIQEAAEWVEGHSPGSYTNVSIYLTDTQVSHIVAEVEALPSKRGEADRFVEWRVAEELSRDPKELIVSWQTVTTHKNDTENVNIYALVADRTLCYALTAAFTTPKLGICGIQSVYNGVANTLKNETNLSLVEVYLDTEYWLTARYRDGEPRSLRSYASTEETGQRALSRDLARAINEEGFAVLRFLRADNGLIDTARIKDQLLESAGNVEIAECSLFSDIDENQDPAASLLPAMMEVACTLR